MKFSLLHGLFLLPIRQISGFQKYLRHAIWLNQIQGGGPSLGLVSSLCGPACWANAFPSHVQPNSPCIFWPNLLLKFHAQPFHCLSDNLYCVGGDVKPCSIQSNHWLSLPNCIFNYHIKKNLCHPCAVNGGMFRCFMTLWHYVFALLLTLGGRHYSDNPQSGRPSAFLARLAYVEIVEIGKKSEGVEALDASKARHWSKHWGDWGERSLGRVSQWIWGAPSSGKVTT